MSAMKCPACGQRHLQAVSACINCGAPLPLSVSHERRSKAQDASAQKPISSPGDDDIVTYENFLTEMAQSPPTEDRPEHFTHTRQPGAHPDNPATTRQLARHDDREVGPRKESKKQAEVEVYVPYETALGIIAPEPFSKSHAGTLMIREEQEDATDPELWKIDKLPWYFPKFRPSTAGTVVLIESKEEAVDYPDLFAAIATLLVELVWVMTDTVQERETDRVVMTTMRVQMYDGSFKDTRMRGNLRGANLSLGDKVSLWGRKRRGVLFISRGFNHTTQGVISTQSIGLLMPALVLILLIALGVFFAPIWIPVVSHTFQSSIGPFFSFFHQHPVSLLTQKGS